VSNHQKEERVVGIATC